MGVSVLELSIVVAVLCVAALARAYAPVGHVAVAEWARAHGLELTRENLPLVVRYLRRARRLRTWGVVVGLLTPTVVRLALGEPVHVAGVGENGSAPGELGAAFVGYLAGAVCAEVSVARPFGAARRSAALLPRELGDYLPRAVVWTQRRPRRRLRARRGRDAAGPLRAEQRDAVVVVGSRLRGVRGRLRRGPRAARGYGSSAARSRM